MSEANGASETTGAASAAARNGDRRPAVGGQGPQDALPHHQGDHLSATGRSHQGGGRPQFPHV